MKVIFISGPYRAKTEWQIVQNILMAREAALWVWSRGHVAICPHMNTAFMGGAPWTKDSTWLNGYLEILRRCDAVYAITGWRDSEGAQAEVDLARSLDIPVFDTVGSIREFVQGAE